MKNIFIWGFLLIVSPLALGKPQIDNEINDAVIAQILMTANKVNIETAALAKKITSHTQVHSFAARMVKEHAEILKQEKDLIVKLTLIPQENSISKELETYSVQNLNNLKYFSQNKFEKNYLETEIKLHQKLITIVDDKLIPNVKNEELKAMMINIRQVLVSHLEHAEKI